MFVFRKFNDTAHLELLAIETEGQPIAQDDPLLTEILNATDSVESHTTLRIGVMKINVNATHSLTFLAGLGTGGFSTLLMSDGERPVKVE